MVVLIRPHESRVFSTKNKGLIENIWDNSIVLVKDKSDLHRFEKWRSKHGLIQIGVEMLNEENKFSTGYTLFLDLRQRLSLSIGDTKKIISRASRIVTTSNHFFSAKKINVQAFLTADCSRCLLIENYEVVPDIEECWGSLKGVRIQLLPPVIDAKRNYNKWSRIYKETENASRSNTIFSAGAIVLHRFDPLCWWQGKYKVNDYFPARKIIHDYSKNFKKIKSYSVILDDNLSPSLMRRLIRFVLNMAGLRKIKSFIYYKKNLRAAAIENQFFLAPPDIFGVIPQMAFEVMSTGVILIGDSTDSFKTLGFEDGCNYLSIGSDWTEENLDRIVRRTATLTELQRSELSARSIDLYNKIHNDALSVCNDLFSSKQTSCH